MKSTILFLLILFNDPNDIALINAYKSDAKKSFLAGDFSKAASQYKFLIDSLNVNEDAIQLNLGHAFYQMGDTAQARNAYNQASLSSDPALKSIAYQQLGVISKSSKNLKESLAYLKASIKAKPDNLDSKYEKYYLIERKIKARDLENALKFKQFVNFTLEYDDIVIKESL